MTATGAGSKTLTLQGSTAGSGEIAGKIVDNSGTNTTTVSKKGTGTWTLSGNNTYSGGTTVDDGRLALGHKNAAGTGTLKIGDTTASPSISLSATTDLSSTGAGPVGNAVTVTKDFTVSGTNNLELSGSVNLGAVNRAVTVSNTGATILSGVVGDGGSGTGGLTKAGAGVMTLKGANTYGGGTTVSAGTLVAANAAGSATGSGAVAVNGGKLNVQAGAGITSPLVTVNGGELIANGTVSGPVNLLSGSAHGTGTITGAVTETGGTLSAGNSIGTLNIGSMLNLTSGSFEWEYSTGPSPAGPSTGADLTNVAGGLNITSATALTAGSSFGSAPYLGYGTRFTVISYAGLWNSGTFNSLPNNSYLILAGHGFQIKYNDTPAGTVNGGAYTNAVTLTAVPEASTFFVIGLGGIFSIALVRLGKRMGVNVLKA